MLLVGHTAICICHFFIAVFILTGFNGGVIFFMCAFLFFYQQSTGPIAWIYVAETVVDAALGVCIQVLWLCVLLLSLTSGPLMESKLTPAGVFFMFSLFSFVAVFFVYFNIAETRGLTEKDKKRLYIPGAAKPFN